MRARRHSFSRGVAWTLLGLAVLLLHGALLQGLRPAPPPPGAAAPPVLQVRSVATEGPLRREALRSAPSPSPVVAPPVAPARAASPRAPVVLPSAEATVSAGAEADSATAARAEPAAMAVGDAPWPAYATRLPAPAELHYRVQRGDQLGRASLSWRPADGGYDLRLDTTWPGQAARGSASRGLIDAGRITFSGPQLAYALRPGVQDRLSWLIQLPAILQADAALARPGASVRIGVVGTRGDAEAWQFEVQRHEALTLPVGPVPEALYLRREPTRPYDSRVEVWLDPARQHLPVRVVFTTVPGGLPLDMALAEAGPAAGLETEAAGPR